MAVTRDGVPVRCWTFPGNTADTAIIRTVKNDLAGWHLRRLVWVADRGFASAANRAYLTRGGGHYIHAEKLRHTNAEAAAALARPGRYKTGADNLRVKEVQVAPSGEGDGDDGARTQRFVVCHNPQQAERDAAVRTNLVTHLQSLIQGSDTWPARRRDEFVGSLKSKPGLRRYLRRTPAGLLRLDAGAIKAESHLDGKWLLRTDDLTLTGEDLAAAYKQLTAVERGWRDMKGALALRPVFHHREDRIRAHVQLCWLALPLIRVAENSSGQTWRTLHHQLDRLHLVTLATGHGTIAQRSDTHPEHKAIWAALDLPGVPRVPWSRFAGLHATVMDRRFSNSMGVSPAEGGVPAAAVVEDFEVVEHRVRQLKAGAPASAVEELDLHAGPEGLDDRVVVAVADGSHRGHQSGLLGAGGERPGTELHAVIGVDDRAGRRSAGVDGHAQGVGDQRRGR